MLKRIKVENFKSFKHLDYKCAKLNLLTGLNGAGKSTFIQLLRLMQKSAKGIESLNYPLPSHETWEMGFHAKEDLQYCYAGANPTCVQIEFDSEYAVKNYILNRKICFEHGCVFFQHEKWDELLSLENDYGLDDIVDRDTLKEDFRRKYSEFLTLPGTEQEKVLSYFFDEFFRIGSEGAVRKRNARQRGEKMRKELESSEANIAARFASIWKGSRFIDSFRGKPHDVHVGGCYVGYPDLGDREVDWCGSIDASAIEVFDPEGGNAIEFLYKFGSGSRGLLKKINQCLQWVSPGMKLEIVKKDVGDQECLLPLLTYENKTTGSGFKPQNVGFGISYILPVLTTLLSAREGNIIIIENPEAHLHPRGQAEIGKLIAETVSRGVQVFIETHSDHVINGIRVAVKKGVVKSEDVNIAFFERKSHNVKKVKWPLKIKGELDEFIEVERDEPCLEIYSEVRNIIIDANGALSEYPTDFMDEWNIQQMKLFRRK